MNWPFENDTNAVVKKLAKKSLKSGRVRNILSILTIILSVALLSGTVLSINGMKAEEDKNLKKSNHATYGNIDSTQMKQIEKDKRISETLLIKQAPNTRIENYLVIPIYIEQNNSNIATEKIVEGTYPKELYEAAVDKAYLKRLGLPETLGTTITISFYDGNTETFTIVGLTDNESTERAYSLYCSKQYAQNGSQLKNAISALAVQIKDADKMSERLFNETVLAIGNSYGLGRRQCDVNDGFAASLTPTNDENLMIVIISLAILAVSYLVIYSIFYIYVQNQVREFGQLRTIGATSKQIRKLIQLQGTILCIIGLVIGLPIGYLIAYFFKPNGWNWFNTIRFSLGIFLYTYLIVFFSLKKPAKMAGMISPIEAAKNTGYEKRVSKKLHRKITPFKLSLIGIMGNRRKMVATILSLGAAGIMFMAGTTLISSLDMERFARHGLLEYGEFHIYLSNNVKKNNQHGQTGVQQNNPLNDDLQKKISKIEGIEEISTLQSLEVQYTYRDAQEKDDIGLYCKENEEQIKPYLLQGNIDYESMAVNKEILVLRNEYSELVHSWKFQVGDIVKFRWFDGKQYQEDDFKIVGEIGDEVFKDPILGKLLGNTQYFLLTDRMLSQMMVPGFNLNNDQIISITDTANEPEIRMQLNELISDIPYITMDTLQDYYQDSRAMYQRTSFVIWGISLFIMLFAVINLVNTLIANTLSRKHEYSLLRSVGMGKRQLQSTIQYEGILLAICNILITLIMGGSVGYGIIRYLNGVGDDSWVYHFPFFYFIGYVAAAILLPVIISAIILRILHKKSLVEQLSSESN